LLGRSSTRPPRPFALVTTPGKKTTLPGLVGKVLQQQSEFAFAILAPLREIVLFHRVAPDIVDEGGGAVSDKLAIHSAHSKLSEASE